MDIIKKKKYIKIVQEKLGYCTKIMLLSFLSYILTRVRCDKNVKKSKVNGKETLNIYCCRPL